MNDYKDILIGYLNDSKKGTGKYLTLTNVSDEQIIIEPGEKVFLNMSPKELREKYPKMPLFRKSVKVEPPEEVIH
jgi:hypothetical protein